LAGSRSLAFPSWFSAAIGEIDQTRANPIGDWHLIADSKFQKRSQLFIRVHNETLSVAAMWSAIQIVRPSQSKAETQPQLQPAFLRLSAIISQYFTRFDQCPFSFPLSNDKVIMNAKHALLPNQPASSISILALQLFSFPAKTTFLSGNYP
jgi:hypothetical protein